MQFLQRLLASKSVLFVGTSLSDVYVRRILEETRYLSSGAGMPHYAICPRLGPVRSKFWRQRFNITVISYDPANEDLSSYEAAVVAVLASIGDRLGKET